MAYIVMAYIVMAYIDLAYIVMAYTEDGAGHQALLERPAAVQDIPAHQTILFFSYRRRRFSYWQHFGLRRPVTGRRLNGPAAVQGRKCAVAPKLCRP